MAGRVCGRELARDVLPRITLAVLESERSITRVSERDIAVRKKLIEAFRELPTGFIENLRYLPTQTGCLNRCSYCAQNATGSLWQMSGQGLANLFSALKTVAIEVAYGCRDGDGKPYLSADNYVTEEGVFNKGFKMPHKGLIGYCRKVRPGSVYPYYDNDVGTYAHLDKYLRYANSDLGVRVRLSTIGYSRHNAGLQAMHEGINANLKDAISSFRISLTPYIFDQLAKEKANGSVSKDEFESDLSNLLSTYAPVVKCLNAGKYAAAVELKFRPLAVTTEVIERIVEGHQIIRAGPYLLVSEEAFNKLEVSKIRIPNQDSVSIDGKPASCAMLISDRRVKNSEGIGDLVDRLTGEECVEFGGDALLRKVNVYVFENEEGRYYSIDPELKETGVMAKEIYPVSGKRRISGYMDSERYFSNSIRSYKKDAGSAYDVTWKGVDDAVLYLRTKADGVAKYDQVASNHIFGSILPMVNIYASALKGAGYAPLCFFDKSFTIDTGELYNLGRAVGEFKGLSSRMNTPLTPYQEQDFGRIGFLSEQGVVWKMGPSIASADGRTEQLLAVEEWDLKYATEEHNEPTRTKFVKYRKLIRLEDGLESIPFARVLRGGTPCMVPGQVPPEDK